MRSKHRRWFKMGGENERRDKNTLFALRSLLHIDFQHSSHNYHSSKIQPYTPVTSPSLPTAIYKLNTILNLCPTLSYPIFFSNFFKSPFTPFSTCPARASSFPAGGFAGFDFTLYSPSVGLYTCEWIE